MSKSIAPGSSADINVKVTALSTNPNVPVTYKTIILKKNLVNGVNTLTQEMMFAQNIKYVIKYDYTLGEDIIVPSNCVLEFDGGSISNGTLVGNNTNIINSTNKAIFTDIKLNGSFINSYISSEWFDGYILNDMFEAISILSKSDINTFINIKNINESVIMDNRYDTQYPVYGLYLPSSNTITEFNNSIIKAYTTSSVLSRVLWIQDKTNVIIKNVNIIGDGENQQEVEYQYAHGVYIQESNNIEFENMHINKMGGDGIAIAFGNNIAIKDTKIEYSGRNNISLIAGHDININNCVLNNAGTINGKLPMCGIDIEPNNNEQRNSLANIKLYNCKFENNEGQSIYCLTDDSINHDIDNEIPLKEDTIIIDSCIYDNFIGTYNGSSGYTIKNSICKLKNDLRARNSKIINCIVPEDFRSEASSNWHSVNNQLLLASDIFYRTAIPIECAANKALKVDILIPATCTHCYVHIKFENRPASNDFVENILHYYYSVDNGYLTKTLDEIQDKNIPQTAVFGNGGYSLAVGSNKSIVNGEIHSLYFKNVNSGRATRGVIYIVGESPRSNIQLYSQNIVDTIPDGVNFLLDIESNKITLDYVDSLETIGNYIKLYRGLSICVANKIAFYNGSSFREYDTASFNVNRSGTFNNKPSADNIYIGFRYFCTDKQTTEGTTNGIEIIHKGNDVWVDALGRVIS